jgi:cell division protein FtsB
MQTKDAAIRKRTQIAKANRTMFLWVAVVSAVVGVSLVGSIFLIQKIAFNEKILSEKNKTISILDKNNNSVSELESQVRVLDSNQALIDSKAKPGDQAVQVILDALPQSANSLALGASLQNKLLAGIPGLTINSLQVDPVVGVESLGDTTTTNASSAVSASGQPQITFRFSVVGSETALKEVLTRLERSIRTIDVTSLRVESQGANRLLTIQARAFYELARTVELKDKVVKP